MQSKLKIAIIGSGRVANYLAIALDKEHIEITQFSRTATGNTLILFEYAERSYQYDLVLLCVSDDAIGSLSSYLEPARGIMAHVSGATGIEKIDGKHQKRGIFYPLMSFSGNEDLEIESVPFCLEANEKQSLEELERICNGIGAKSFRVSSEQRKHLHLAAVLSQNFTNYLYQIASEVMEDANLDIELLKPLLLQSVNRLGELPPIFYQTGPAVRNDEKTISEHLKMLEDDEMKDLYRTLSNHIVKKYDEEL